ncbi:MULTISPECIES: hypothetical protein [unclassified Massilia]|uniref:hypothetical protein n=1 Tax=unclassified Massilia TaxID=2609279 RepID=UPI00177D2BDC|nr:MULTISPECIES: hypothetical protein [unclassified Massilia]MBD8529281.1 hypothetical protein [Massilia sp. CFBP 13647]MBD8672675.1 hypothetical protein [Massilia sp. CFBP 13721]
MEDEQTWIDNSGGGILQYDFVPPHGWSAERIVHEHLAMAATIDAPDLPAAPVPGWLALVRRLPAALRSALMAELRAGNRIAGIGSTGWPHEGSVVVTLRARFSVAREALPDGVRWRSPEDPHYAREELSQQVGAVEFLILA